MGSLVKTREVLGALADTQNGGVLHTKTAQKEGKGRKSVAQLGKNPVQTRVGASFAGGTPGRTTSG